MRYRFPDRDVDLSPWSGGVPQVSRNVTCVRFVSWSFGAIHVRNTCSTPKTLTVYFGEDVQGIAVYTVPASAEDYSFTSRASEWVFLDEN